MSRDHIAQRMLCGEAGIDASRVRRGLINEKDWPILASAAGRLASASIYIDDNQNYRLNCVRKPETKDRKNLGLVIADYLQLMSGHIRTENRQQEIFRNFAIFKSHGSGT